MLTSMVQGLFWDFDLTYPPQLWHLESQWWYWIGLKVIFRVSNWEFRVFRCVRVVQLLGLFEGFEGTYPPIFEGCEVKGVKTLPYKFTICEIWRD